MIKDGKYRYTLQFGMTTNAEQQAGQFLERLGNRKSPFIVAAVNEYLAHHPELLNSQANIQFQITGVDPKMLEAKIRQLIEERLSSTSPPPVHPDTEEPETVQQVSSDILDMLCDLEIFN